VAQAQQPEKKVKKAATTSKASNPSPPPILPKMNPAQALERIKQALT
jgi:hypothetical protein